jgi:hypothetical protein
MRYFINMRMTFGLLAFIMFVGSAHAQSRVGTYYFGWDWRILEHKEKGRLVKARIITIAPPTISLQLKADGTYTMKEYKRVTSGRYTIKGNELYMVLSRTTIRPRSVFKGNDIVQDKRSWRKAGYEGWVGLNERFIKQPVEKAAPLPTAAPSPAIAPTASPAPPTS